MDTFHQSEIRAAVLADLGGEEDVSEVALRDLLSAHLAASGPLTKAGKRRAALDAWERASVRCERLAARIGTDRRPRQVPSLAEALG